MLERTKRKTTTEVVFVLPAEQPAGAVSVVGDFNDWEPGKHSLAVREDGMRAVSVKMPSDSRIHFRYLAHGDYWFDEQDADGHDGANSYLHT